MRSVAEFVCGMKPIFASGFGPPDDASGAGVSVHISAVGRAGLREGKKVSYEITQDHRSGKSSTDQLNEIRDRLFSAAFRGLRRIDHGRRSRCHYSCSKCGVFKSANICGRFFTAAEPSSFYIVIFYHELGLRKQSICPAERDDSVTVQESTSLVFSGLVVFGSR